ncbi:ABC transporter substrate-binding protein [Georgenia sp. AZ-5]|uniref:ABC transporter substrate-binding protein n=1 Tax=Georgenia sp. AZ-5 TaxID=3367526 RepID=UPI0037552684
MPSTIFRAPRRAVVLFSGALAASLLAACGGSSLAEDDAPGSAAPEDAGPVKIGLSVPLSGVYAPLGEDMQQGFELYLEEHDNQLGGYDVDLVSVDEGEGPQAGVPATQKLVTQDQVSAVVGIVNSATAAGLRDTFIQAEVPFIVANAGADEITAEPSDYIWRTSFVNSTVGGSIGAAVAEEVGDGSVYLITADYAAGHEQVGGFREAFEAAGGKVAGESFTPFGTTSDWQPYLSEIRSSGAAAAFSFYAGAEAVNFVKQYDTFGLSDSVKLYGTGFLTEGAVLEAQGGAAVGTKTALHYSHTIESDRNAEFVEAYEAAYGEVPTVYSVQAYDAAAALDLALEDAESTDGAGIAAALGGIGEIDSPRGPWSFDESHNPDQPYYLREVQEVDGGLVNVAVRELG